MEVVGEASHVQRDAHVLHLDIDALFSGVIVRFLVNAIVNVLQPFEQLNDLVESLEVSPQDRDVNVGQLQVIKGRHSELGQKSGLHTEGQHVAELEVEDLLVRREAAVGLLILDSTECVDHAHAYFAQHRDGCAVEVVGNGVGHGGRSTEAGWWGN